MKTPFLTTSFSENGKQMKKRFENILNRGMKKKGIAALIIIAALAIVISIGAKLQSPIKQIAVVCRDSGGRADAIMLCSYDENNKLSICNIPPQTLSSDGTRLADRYAQGDLLSALSELRGEEIEKYIDLDFQAFRTAVDAVGGVDFFVPIDMQYDDPYQELHINLDRGMQHLDGEKAEMLMRYRKGNISVNGNIPGYENGAIDRIYVQNSFINALYKSISQNFNTNQLIKFLPLLNNCRTNLSPAEAKRFITSFTAAPDGNPAEVLKVTEVESSSYGYAYESTDSDDYMRSSLYDE